MTSAGRGNLGAPPNPPSLESKRSSSWPVHCCIALADWLASNVCPSAADSEAMSGHKHHHHQQRSDPYLLTERYLLILMSCALQLFLNH